ncbi:MAG TPA: erythromycin esterase family protein [Rhizomicrobium sp.]|nr:erythromycin esterase family protein [Rhizomicrobium sp.]
MAHIKDIAVALRTLNPDDEDWSDLAPIRKLIGDARVVGVGEAAHGVGQFHDLRHRLLRFLVEELGFTAYCTEFPFDEGIAINEWIHGGPGKLGDVTQLGRHAPFGEGTEARAHLEWMRAWNAKNGNRLSFYGLDVGSIESAVRLCLSRIPAKPDDAKFLATLNLGAGFAAMIKLMGMPEAERAGIIQGLNNLLGRAKAAGDEIAIRCAMQALASTPGGVASNNAREEYMADNVAWILERERRIMIGGHNGHIRRASPDLPSLGQLLQAQLPAPPVAIGTTYGAGPIWDLVDRSAPPPEFAVSVRELNPPAHTLDAMMAQVGLPLHFVDLDLVSDEQLAKATDMMTFHSPLPVNVRLAFDGIIHVHNVRSMDDSWESARKQFRSA